MTRVLFFLLLVGTALGLTAQTADLPLNHSVYHYVDRIDIQGLTGRTIHTDIKPYGRRDLSEIFRDVDTQGMSPRDLAWFELVRNLADDEIQQTQERTGFRQHLYPNRRDLFTVQTDDFRLYVNPVLHLFAGQDVTSGTNTPSNSIYRNTRGLRIRGDLFRKVGFYTEVSENQVKYPHFVDQYADELGILWGENFVKDFDANTPNPGYDYFNARGYITYSPVKQLRIKLGKDRAFWGNGRQSMLLSDHATDYFFLNLNTRIWKLQYVNTFALMTDFLENKPDSYGTYPRKYGVFHQLFYQPTNWLSVGAFESVIYAPNLPGGRRGFEAEYLNPIIFYRSVEQSLGSPDNSSMGVTWKANFMQRFQFYGQLALDDFNFRVRDQGSGFAGNKYGYQLGLKYINAFWIPRLDLQLEYNRIRPYTYSHFNPAGNYAHFGQPLAHPLGGNLYEFNFVARYQPFPRWNGFLALTALQRGLDMNGQNMGGDIFQPYTSAPNDFGNVVGQGDAFNMTMVQGRVSYQILRLHSFLELEARYRSQPGFNSVSVLGGFRFNIAPTPIRF